MVEEVGRRVDGIAPRAPDLLIQMPSVDGQSLAAGWTWDFLNVL